MIERNYYLNKIIRAMGNGDVKVITGIPEIWESRFCCLNCFMNIFCSKE